jgi:hypothetical protein
MITPEDFEILVQDTMRGVDAQTRPDGGLTDRLLSHARRDTSTVVAFRRRRNWIAPLLAAAAVVAFATTIALVAGRSGTHTPSGGHTPSPVIQPSTSTSTSMSSVPPPSQAGTCLSAAQALAIVSHARGGTVTLAPHEGFACAHGWAYLNFQGPVSPNTATVDLHFVNGQWVIGDRGIACGDANGVGTTPPAMVSALVQGGCGN